MNRCRRARIRSAVQLPRSIWWRFIAPNAPSRVGSLELLNSSQERLPAFAQVDWKKALGWLQCQTGQDLAPGQQDAVKLALTSKVAVLTGGPGCGKSFTVRSVVELATAKKATSCWLRPPVGRPSGWPS